MQSYAAFAESIWDVCKILASFFNKSLLVSLSGSELLRHRDNSSHASSWVNTNIKSPSLHMASKLMFGTPGKFYRVNLKEAVNSAGVGGV